MDKVVGIGEYAVSNGETDRIKTFALASCIAVTAYSPCRRAAGMVHIALPTPAGSGGDDRPGYYATTGVPLLINGMCREFGCFKGELRIYMYGGADSINARDLFIIGRRNIETVIQVLSGMNLKVHHAEVGGLKSRTVEMDVATGNIFVTYRQITI